MTSPAPNVDQAGFADPDRTRESAILRFATWCAAERGGPAGSRYDDLWEWSVAELEGFWSAIWTWFGVQSDSGYTDVLTGAMPNARWFTGARVNYGEHALRNWSTSATAIVEAVEAGSDARDGAARQLSGHELRRQVGALATTLRSLGIGARDRVVGYLPNTAEAVVAFLATASLGAVWASCGQDYGPEIAASRFAQLGPVALIAADGYRFAGQARDRRAQVASLQASLPTLRTTILVNRLDLDWGPQSEPSVPWDQAIAGNHLFVPVRVPFEHPLWVLFSSGTTGTPKGIVHSHGGVLLEHLKSLSLHLDLDSGDTFFWYTTPSWMVWNYLVSGLLLGTRVVCYEGSPNHPGPEALWSLAERFGVTYFGASPGYLQACAKAGVDPARQFDLSRLRAIGSSGSPLPASSNHWIADHIGPDIQVNSISGGTDVVSAFAAAAPNTPVWPGEISARCLGVAMEAWDEHGRSLLNEVGELVITKPMPSMPIAFWDDVGGVRYREAYFDTFPGIWRHGDWITVTSRGSVVIHGRSDSTLNRNGVRMGSADIYSAVERLPEVSEALVIGAEQSDGGYWMPLFLRLVEGQRLDTKLQERVRTAIREHASPRHLPDEILQITGVPHTRTGKKLEIPVKRILQGTPPERVADRGAVDDPLLLDYFVNYRAERLAREAGTNKPLTDMGNRRPGCQG